MKSLPSFVVPFCSCAFYLSHFVSFSTLVAFLLVDLGIFYVIEYLHTGLVSTVVRTAPRKIVNSYSWPLSGPYAITWWCGILSIPNALDLTGGRMSQLSSYCGRMLILLLADRNAIEEQLPVVVGHDLVSLT